jgi:hypothetical protein
MYINYFMAAVGAGLIVGGIIIMILALREADRED